ncbi:MAG: helix-turn-helix domain-containing protein [Muribaculaceae bacterium]|nr:helix-turn-helix transcriptional regulator [Bacteroides sp.]MDE5847048.1 helix-turn-helix domain-containing protein [Muribaculaceae bacterium]MDE6195176.1 helix-turn-helix domain-containing protein [Muribaculaceae bacterium]MDE6855116.1 helix-turn-helix domain-containing protein [Muribaculaceae bacterium]
MRKLDPEKLVNLTSFNDELDDKYGVQGTPSREQFDEESLAWFYGNMLRERRKELNLTQKQVAEKLGREQSYIARVESGKADIQLSSFFRIAAILGIQFVPTFMQVIR